MNLQKNVQIPSLEGYNVDQIIQMFKEYKQTYGGSAVYRYRTWTEEDYGHSWTETRTSLDVRESKLKIK